MKKLSFLLFFFLCLNSFAQDVWVNGYSRSDGKVVQSHYRTSPDQTVNNNFTTIGNTNPYTGKTGTLPRDNGYAIQAPQSSINLPLIQNALSNNQNNYEISVTVPLDGGYTVPKIIEQILENGIWKTVKEEKSISYLFFDKNLVCFKRGSDNWLGRHQVFLEYNAEKKLYIYNSEYGLSLLDEYLKFILFYDKNNKSKRYIYLIGNSVLSIVPTL